MNQSNRLTEQHKKSNGVLDIFNVEAQEHDSRVARISKHIFKHLCNKYPGLRFRYRVSLGKEEINDYLHNLDAELGVALYVANAKIKPDGGIIEVEDDNGNWRVVLVSEAKFQGKDIDNIRAGKLVGKNNNQDLMVAGNAIERAYKNIFEIANYMLGESHFPYVLFLEGANFLTESVSVERPDGRIIVLNCNSGALNRIDRLTAANYGMAINTNLSRNKFIRHKDKTIMLQATSIYTKGNGECWDDTEMFQIMYEIANTSIQMLASDLFKQLV